MHNIFKTTALAVAVTLGCSSSAFSADGGTITFNGNVTDVTCEASVDGVGSGDGVVNLPNVNVSQLASQGATAGETPFTIDVADCTALGAGTVTAFFQSGSNVDASGYLNNTGSATGVGIKLMTGTGTNLTDIEVGSATQAQATALNSNGGSLYYSAAYVVTGSAATAGDVASTVKYVLDYN